jgi:prophage regulatory protein
MTAPRTVLRLPAVLATTGWSRSTLYEKVAAGSFPKPMKLDADGNGRAIGWYSDQICEHQDRVALRALLAEAK